MCRKIVIFAIGRYLYKWCHNGKVMLTTLIAECTAYDFKLTLEEKRPKSWLKSVSAFANGLGGSLFFGIDNDGTVKGLDDVQRVAFVRNGDESVPATAEQMMRLVLMGSNRTFDSLPTDYKVSGQSFTILANAYKTRTGNEWASKYLLSFGLVTGSGYLTYAGALFADNSPLPQSRLYCTRWDGEEKGDAINDAEFSGNVLMLLREAINFVRSNTKRGWTKLPTGRKNKTEYAERAVLEAMVNHFIHRDYTVMGGEVHLDIYDNRIVVTSPGGMYNGLLIQNLNIAEVSSERRNPILANVMAQLDYMEKRGSGLTRICNETMKLSGYDAKLKPAFKSTATQFQTIIFAVSDMPHVGDMSEMQLTERQRKVLSLVENSPVVTAKKMSETLSVSQRTVERDIAMLRRMGIIRRKGGDNDGIWVVEKQQ